MPRNPIVQIGKARLKILGDVHLGREFKEFVPLARRGEREGMVWTQFLKELDDISDVVSDVDAIIQTGDLFDKFTVSNKLVLDTARALRRASVVPIFILRGNHDASRDTSVVSSFEILRELIGDSIRFIESPTHYDINGEKIGFVPWDPFLSASELIAKIPAQKYSAIFGHWDIESFGKPNPNLIPIETLSNLTSEVFTGHIHSPGEFVAGSCKVHVVGSMQPYSFAEDPDGEMYMTMTVSEALSKPSDFFRDKNLRLVMSPTEEMPLIDCLQLRPKTVDQEKIDAKVEFEQFDFKELFDAAFEDVDDDIKAETWNHYLSLKESSDL